ncbi:MAG: hypothetical protein DHS20C16_10350 [Phycisphaerae bacterium]|nr:MAG: hypothetical protein DHS20C16_10350 [Phycisphaerae bacterium]
MLGNRLLPISFFVCLLATVPTRAEVTVRDPGTFVIDQAQIINADAEQSLNAILKELEEKTTSRVKILTIQSLEGEDINGFAIRHAETWKLNYKGKENGSLIVLSVSDRKVKIEVGYGLEGDLPDSWCGSASRAVAQQYFKAGNYSDGLHQLGLAVANKVADSSNVQLTGVPRSRLNVSRHSQSRKVRTVFGGCFLPFFLFLLFLVRGIQRNRGGRNWGGHVAEGVLWGMVFGGRGGGGWGGSGGGWGGGGFGGGGFGGGGFGGGGGGASW